MTIGEMIEILFLPPLLLLSSYGARGSAFRRDSELSCCYPGTVVLSRNPWLSSEKENSYKKTQKPCNMDSGDVRSPLVKSECLPLSGIAGYAKTKFNKNKGCSSSTRLARVARTCVRFISAEHRTSRVSPLPRQVSCGYLRSAVRACFAEDLPVELELSIKTSQKLEQRYCHSCNESRGDVVKEWKQKRLEPVGEENGDFMGRFVKALRSNVDPGWNRRDYPYIPTGNATLEHSRCQGGSWNVEELRFDCRPVSIISSGKPRIVTLFSGEYTRILSPLHKSLYSSLKRKGWLLVGPPTDDRVKWLNGDQEYVSIDYSSATDNIKLAFVQAAVDVLISAADGLTQDQLACLRAFASLTFEDGAEASTGQPMGSVMSFPVLCLINKTVVDLALLDLLEEGEISFKEWTSHRCLINGDDLLYRELYPGLRIYSRILANGSRVGLVVNKEKTLKDRRIGEINSTAFCNGTRVKKVNCAALFMATDVTDVLGLARESSRTLKGFKELVKRNLAQLERQETKVQSHLPRPLREVLWRDPRIAAAVTTKPLFGKDERVNFFPVTRKPVGYQLTRREETDAINAEVARLQSIGSKQPRGLTRPVLCLVGGQKRAYVHRSNKLQEDTILTVLAAAWRRKEWEGMQVRDPVREGGDQLWNLLDEFDGERKLSVIDKMVRTIREGRGDPRKPTDVCSTDVIDIMRFYSILKWTGTLDDNYVAL